MAIKLPIPFPIFAPILNPSNPNSSRLRQPSEIRFARWNNANAESFNQRRRAQQEIEDDLRRSRRFTSATKIADVSDTESTSGDTFKSVGTPSSPSRPSIPGKKSKYSKNPNSNSSSSSHPAFRRFVRISKISDVPDEKPVGASAKVTVSEDGVSYLIEGAPFEILHSYTETPKVKPLKLREAPYSPFGPTTIQRPWTGRAPLPPSKKKLKEFDSFVLPPPGKKGVKPVQSPGPFLQGSGPKYVMSREEILGEPLTAEEIKELIKGCLKTKRQLNIGRDGLTHNMLDNIHAHWKRRRVCKIKCKGVCTVDMDNVRQQLEEKTGGKIIYSRGGLLYLFRGRNYNYKTRPRFPLMLWKPVTPVYPRLIKHAPEGLTLEEATEMRKKGRKLIPICKLGKNGVYAELVKHVREAFEECELVRINCEGMNGSDYRKIGAKLKDLVPCVLISFEREHILMWRGQDWKFSFPKLDVDQEEAKESNAGDATFIAPSPENQTLSVSHVSSITGKDSSPKELSTSILPKGSGDASNEGSTSRDRCIEIDQPHSADDLLSTQRNTYTNASISGNFCADDDTKAARNTYKSETVSGNIFSADDESKTMSNNYGTETISANDSFSGDGSEATSNILCETTSDNQDPAAKIVEPDTLPRNVGSLLQSFLVADMNNDELNRPAWSSTPSIERVLLLCKQAVEGGNAAFLGDSTLDADIVYTKAVSFAQSAPPGPVFHRPSSVVAKKFKPQETVEAGGVIKTFKPRETDEAGDSQTKEVLRVPGNKESERKSSKVRRKDVDQMFADDVPQGSLRIDELAKLLA